MIELAGGVSAINGADPLLGLARNWGWPIKIGQQDNDPIPGKHMLPYVNKFKFIWEELSVSNQFHFGSVYPALYPSMFVLQKD